MSETQLSVGKRAYRLYNKVSATERDKVNAKLLIDAEKFEDLDVYGRFVYAELIFWKMSSTAVTYAQAVEIFQKIIVDKQSPKTLVVGACFFLGRMYELGLGVDYNTKAADIHYRLANKLNPKACVKDIARLEKILSSEPKELIQKTPDRYRYDGGYEHDCLWEYYKYLGEWSEDYEKCKQSLKESKFFYADDPDEVEIDLYDEKTRVT